MAEAGTLNLVFEGEDEPNAWRPTKAFRGRMPDQESREYNQALLDIVEGRRGLYAALAILTGLSIDGIKCRTVRARHLDTPEDHVGESPELSDADLRYFENRYRNSKDPAILEFVGQQRLHRRSRPDFRTAADRDC